MGRLPTEIRTQLARTIAAQRAALAVLRPPRAPDLLDAIAGHADVLPAEYVLVDDPGCDRAVHAGLLRLWRRVMSDESAPCLVLVTARDGISADFFQQLLNSDFLDKRFFILDRAAHGDLASLRRNCKLRLTRDRPGSADASRVLYFDPDNVTAAHAEIMALLRA